MSYWTKIKSYLAVHHTVYLAIAAIIVTGYVLAADIKDKSFTQVQNHIQKEIVEGPKAQ
jgi:hypothetical protein